MLYKVNYSTIASNYILLEGKAIIPLLSKINPRIRHYVLKKETGKSRSSFCHRKIWHTKIQLKQCITVRLHVTWQYTSNCHIPEDRKLQIDIL